MSKYNYNVIYVTGRPLLFIQMAISTCSLYKTHDGEHDSHLGGRITPEIYGFRVLAPTNLHTKFENVR